MKFHKITLIIITANIFFAIAEHLNSEVIAITGGTIIRTDRNDSIPNSVILIKDSIITDAGPMEMVVIPENAQLLDVKGKYIVPGLFDSHIHFFQSGGLYTRPDIIDLRNKVPYIEKEKKEIVENIEDTYKRYLACGITNVLNAGSTMSDFELRDKSKNILLSPEIYTSGPLISSYQPEALNTDDPPIIKVNSIKQALELVKQQIEKKADFIKIWYIASFKGAMDPAAFYPIVKAICDYSHKNNLPVLVHATELETAKKAINAGCDVLVHSVTDKIVDDELLRLCKEKEIIYVPTLWVFKSYEAVFTKQLKLLPVEHLRGNPKIIGTLYDMWELSVDEIGERARKAQLNPKPIEIDSILMINLKKVYDYGITIAAGTDAGNIGVLHGPSLFREFMYMKLAGMSEFDIIRSATVNAAKILRKEATLGSIAKGRLANMVILNTNPLADIQNLTDIKYLGKKGVFIDGLSLMKKSPSDLAQIQLNAYNSRDINSFLTPYSDTVSVYEFPDKKRSQGKDAMKEIYTVLFDKSPMLHCKLVNRIANNNYVVDHEKVSGLPGRPVLNAVAVYEIKDGLIINVWFLP